MQELDDVYTTFVRAARLSGIVDRDLLSKIVEDYESNCPADRSSDVKVRELITRFLGQAILTPWQCGKLMLGRYKGFIFDHYVLRDYLGVHVDCPDIEVYLARDLREKTLDVVLEFEHFMEDLESGRRPRYSIKYQRRATH